MRIDQLIPAYHRGDAIGDTADHMKRFFRAKGMSSEIYCLTRDPGLEGESRFFADFPQPGAGDITLLHFALPSPLTEAFVGLAGHKLIIYHNITPAHFFQKYSAEMTRISRLGREELLTLAPHVDIALADSEYNRRELEEFGFPRTRVFPLFIDFEKYSRPADPHMTELFRDERTNILFVGRIVPNKKIEELIKTVFTYKKYISPLVRLIVVGKTSSLPEYHKSLVRMADEFYLQPEEICFTGHVSDEEMYALYRESHVFLSLSEHEGFGLPFVESMVFDLPIIAYECTAVPYTLGEAGILISEKSVDFVAELVHRVASDQVLREKIVMGQRRQLRKYQSADAEKFLLKILETLSIGDD